MMMKVVLWCTMLHCLVLVHCQRLKISDQQSVAEERVTVEQPMVGEAKGEELLGVVVREIVEQHKPDCHVLLLTSTPHSSLFSTFLR